ncbi:hypothetical protein AcV5_009505 [Taiwanofungus camphoratus]|nr:hypothetical protein AcV5_009505 [Antrodia cinnamomea]
MIIYNVLCGIGAGLTFQTTLISLQSAVDRKEMAVITAVRNFFRAIDGIAGLTIAGAILNNTFLHKFARRGIPRDVSDAIMANPVAVQSSKVIRSALTASQVEAVFSSYMQGIQNLFRFCIPASGLSFLVSCFLIGQQELSREDDEEQKAAAKKWLDERKARVKRDGATVTVVEADKSTEP